MGEKVLLHMKWKSLFHSLQPPFPSEGGSARAAPKKVRKMKNFDKKFDKKRGKIKIYIAKNGEKVKLGH